MKLFVILAIWMCSSSSSLLIDKGSYRLQLALQLLHGLCFDYSNSAKKDITYKWCYSNNVTQITRNPATGELNEMLIGKYFNVPSISPSIQIYNGEVSDCKQDDQSIVERSAVVALKCCIDVNDRSVIIDEEMKKDIYIDTVDETVPCTHSIGVCTNVLCDLKEEIIDTDKVIPAGAAKVSVTVQDTTSDLTVDEATMSNMDNEEDEDIDNFFKEKKLNADFKSY